MLFDPLVALLRLLLLMMMLLPLVCNVVPMKPSWSSRIPVIRNATTANIPSMGSLLHHLLLMLFLLPHCRRRR